ncbi:polysaccharide biosynthesis/export family protein [Bacteroidota bacterium]|nr:polysaccharide biosynthesis/export family protein [Bacteroidota bacterium]
MKFSSLMLICVFLASCSTKNQIIYLKDAEKVPADKWVKNSKLGDYIEAGDILKIDVYTVINEASLPYNKDNFDFSNKNLDMLKLEGYTVDDQMNINFPVLGKISVEMMNEEQLEDKITYLLDNGDHLNNPTVSVRKLNKKFTVLGEVMRPGTFSYIEKNLNIFQALGYAGDITIDGKRKDVTFIRSENGKRNIYNVELTKSEFLKSDIYNIKNNDIIIINPNYSKVKSAGFIGNPSSIASIASLLLSITLLITNN